MPRAPKWESLATMNVTVLGSAAGRADGEDPRTDARQHSATHTAARRRISPTSHEPGASSREPGWNRGPRAAVLNTMRRHNSRRIKEMNARVSSLLVLVV